jgi:CDGSH-type Zn-finger protein
MAVHETKGTDHPITSVKLDKGDKVALCRCFKSTKFPYCDGAHRNEPGKGPALVQAPEEA